MKLTLLFPLLLLVHSSSFGENITLTGTDGVSGSNGAASGDDGAEGGNGESLTRTAEDAADADKTVSLTGGRGGKGGSGRDSNVAVSGSGGPAGKAGDAVAGAIVNLDLPTQQVTLTSRGGAAGDGGNAGAGNSLIYGNGGTGGDGGNGLATLTLNGGGSTAVQKATVNATGAGGRFGGSGVLRSADQQGGMAGQGGRGGLASAEMVMRGSAATVTQNLTATIRGGDHGNHGAGAGLAPLAVPPTPLVNAEASLDLLNIADNAAINPTISINGGNGHGIQAPSGAFPASMGRLQRSRIEATGDNAAVLANVTVTGGSASLWQMPSGLAATYITPETLASGSDGAEALAEGLEIVAGNKGRITGSLSLTGGGGGHRTGPAVAGSGAAVRPGAGILKGTSQGGNVTLTLTATGGGRGTNSQGTDGIGGDAVAVNSVIGESTTGDISLTQSAIGGHGGGRAVSSIDHTGTTTGGITVVANATGGPEASFPTPELAIESTLGSAEAICHVAGAGSLVRADANARARSAASAVEGADARAEARATGLRNVRATATATGGDAVIDGLARAVARADFSQPGPTNLAVASAQVQGLRDGQSTEATAIAPGSPLTPVAGMTAYCLGANLAVTGQSTSTHAAVSNGGGIGLLTGGFGFGGSHTFSSVDANPATVFSFGSLNTNPAVATFFANLPSERHLVTCRPVQKAGAIDFSGGRTVTRRFGGSFQLSDCLSGGQLVLSGLGTTNREGALDTMNFTVRRDSTVVFESTDPAIFTNTVTALDDLGNATSASLFEWELVTTATSGGQTFESYFAFSATAGSGLGANLAVDPLPVVAGFEFAPSTEPGASAGQRRIGLQLTGGAPLGALLIEVSTDLGLKDPWKAVRALTLDAAGALSFEEVIDFGPAGAASGFIRICRP